ncbi:MAG: hypothetical protein H0T78_12755 [Longispora sp.]|nr:hypothetical protein [Longispora sp. (in: high G+C Gram-positive bacteria)]
MAHPLLLATGTPTEIGAQYGQQAADLIAGNLDDYLRKFRDMSGWTAREVTEVGVIFQATTRQYVPRIAETLDAMADAAGIPVGDVYALNARTELMLPPELARSANRPPSGAHRPTPSPTECTGVAVLSEYTATGHTLLAQNWDWYPSQAHYAVVLATRDERDHTIVTMTEAGMLAKAGLNSRGVGVCVNLLGSDRDGATGGVPYHVLIRHVLDQPDGIATSLRVTALPRSASINLLIAVAGDTAAGGTALDLELAPGAVGRVLPEGGLLTHSNHFVSSIAVRDRCYDLGGSSLFRDFRLRQLLTEAAAERRVTEGDVCEALRDHLGYPSAICRHVNPAEVADGTASLTVSSVVMDLDARRLMVNDGPPCESKYEVIDMETLTF